MKKATLIHPRKLSWAMRDFLDEVIATQGLTKYGKPITSKMEYRKGYMNFGINAWLYYTELHGNPNKVVFIYDPKMLMDSTSRDYRDGLGFVMADMVHRANYMKGFAQVTRILLHEVGHLMTYKKVRETHTDEELSNEYLRSHDGNKSYARITEEWEATQWAIEWLADPNHRKIARDFEKKFWTCFA